IVKILTLYTPHSDLDERVTLNFIRTVQGLLKGRSDCQPPQLLMDVRTGVAVQGVFSVWPGQLDRTGQIMHLRYPNTQTRSSG
ncbi:unconventional myosin-Va-like protein, partial [Lates japonicus]